MRLIFVNQYYPPDAAPTGLMLETVAELLVADGHEVTILCAKGGYAAAAMPAATGTSPASSAAPRVVRVGATTFGRRTFLGKLADYATFYLGVAWKLATLHPRPDRVIALTTPPYLSLLARVFSRLRRADHAHWVMDLYPDVMVAHGMLHAGGLPDRLLQWLARAGFGGHRCHTVVTLGPDMSQRIARYLGPCRRSPWVPLWGTGSSEPPSTDESRTPRAWAEDELVLMYSGNMGLGHRFGEFLELAAANLPKTRFVFAGGGKRLLEIKAFLTEHPAARAELRDYAPREHLASHLAAADVHLASLEPAWDGTMVPSKLQGIFAAGRPVIFIGSATCSIGRWIRESGGGWVVPPGDAAALRAAVDSARDPAERTRRGQAATAYAKEHFDRARNARRVAAHFIDP